MVLLVLFLLVAAGAYAALVWYPVRAAGELMRPASADYVPALEAFRAAMSTVPSEDADAQTAVSASEEILARTQDAREALTEAQLALEDRSTTELPVISDQPPLDEALSVRNTMLSFYTGALEAVGNVESVARYLGALASSLPQLEDIEEEVDGASDGGIGAAVATATPISRRLVADLEAIAPPDEVGAVHSTLEAIAQRIQDDLAQIDRAGSGSGPVIRALLNDIEEEAQGFRDTVAETPAAAVETGLRRGLKKLDRQSNRIAEGLEELRAQGVAGITVPD